MLDTLPESSEGRLWHWNVGWLRVWQTPVKSGSVQRKILPGMVSEVDGGEFGEGVGADFGRLGWPGTVCQMGGRLLAVDGLEVYVGIMGSRGPFGSVGRPIETVGAGGLTGIMGSMGADWFAGGRSIEIVGAG